MKEIISTISRNDLESLLENKGQSKVGFSISKFASRIPKITTIEDLKYVDALFYSFFQCDKHTKKFACTVEEIFARKTFSGCSDIGLAMATILRIKKIPTVYVESAKLEWIKYVQEKDEKQELMQGHIFLEIFLDNKWYLYDPTFRKVYDDYDYNNIFLPREYVVFAKGLNCHEIGVHSVLDEKRISINILQDFDTSSYKTPNYKEIDLKNLTVNDNSY